MQVPLVQQNVEMQPPHANEPQISAPIDMGQVAVAKGNEAIANGVGDIANVMEKYAIQQHQWRSQEQAYSAASKFREEMQRKMYDTKTTKISGPQDMSKVSVAGPGGFSVTAPQKQDYEVPAGYLMRQGYQAQNMVPALQKDIEGTKAKYLSGLSPYAQKLYLRAADSHAASIFDMGVKHQAQQEHEAGIQTRQNLISDMVSGATNVQSSEDLKRTLANIVDVHDHSTTFDPAKFNDVSKEKVLVQAVNNASNNALLKTGDLDLANEILSSGSSFIPPEKANEISVRLDRAHGVMQQQAIRADKETKISNGIQMMSGVANGQIDVTRLNDVENANIPEPLRMSIMSALQSKGIAKSTGVDVKNIDLYLDETKHDDVFAEHMANVMRSADQEKILTELTDAMHGFGKGTISQDRLDIITRLAIQRSKALPKLPDGTPITLDPKAVKFDAGVKYLDEWMAKSAIKDKGLLKAYLDAVDANKDPKDAVDAVIKNKVTSMYPQSVTMDSVPNMVVGKGSPSRIFLFNRADKVYTHKVWNPSKGAFETNQNREKSTGGQ